MQSRTTQETRSELVAGVYVTFQHEACVWLFCAEDGQYARWPSPHQDSLIVHGQGSVSYTATYFLRKYRLSLCACYPWGGGGEDTSRDQRMACRGER